MLVLVWVGINITQAVHDLPGGQSDMMLVVPARMSATSHRWTQFRSVKNASDEFEYLQVCRDDSLTRELLKMCTNGRELAWFVLYVTDN